MCYFKGEVKKNIRQRGLTLVELMVVIVIISLLATIVVINVVPAGDNAAIKKAQADIAVLENALMQYRLELSTYPTTAQGLEALINPPNNLSRPEAYRVGGYIQRLPADPWGTPYNYELRSQSGDFLIYTLGADNAEGGEGINADFYNK